MPKPSDRLRPGPATLRAARRVLTIEAAAIRSASLRLGNGFLRAVARLRRLRGRIVVTGMGKSGLIGQKIAATLTSTGTPALFLHPAEAAHGDLGAVTPGDAVLAISLSGETREIVELLPSLARLGVPIVAMTGEARSTLGSSADAVLDIGVRRESCPLNLAPTASAATTLALGDALAMVLMRGKGFTVDDFAAVHPGGSLGRRVASRVDDHMRSGRDNPIVRATDTFAKALGEITRTRAGAVSVVDRAGRLLGLVTDGDVRRLIASSTGSLASLRRRRVSAMMRPRPITVPTGARAGDVLRILRAKALNVVPVVDASLRPVGMVHVHDLLRAGISSR